MGSSLRQEEIDPKTALKALDELALYSFGGAEFELVYHWGTKGKLTSFRAYCERLIRRSGLFRLDENNHVLNLRLHWILNRCDKCRPSGKELEELCHRANAAYPPIAKSAK